MRNKTVVPAATFKALFQELISWSFIYALLRRWGVRRRRPPLVTIVEVIQSLVFHVVAEAGTLAQHVKQLTGKTITDGALSQRRALLPPEVFEALMAAALKPKAEPKRHPDAFYHGLRLCGVDGSTFSVTNTPQVKKRMRKAKSRRGRAAFPKVGVAVLVEIRAGGQTRLVREIVGRVQRGGRGASTTVRLWTSLLDWQRHPATELLALYTRRWEQEVFYKELKVDARSTPNLQSHTPLTAMQETPP
jgi:hypothetical protein